MQDVDCPAHVEAFSQPSWTCCPCVEAQPLSVVARLEHLDGIGGHCDPGRHLREPLPIGASERQRAVGLSLYLLALLVHRAVVPATEHGKIRERGRAALRPVAHVMPLAEWEAAAREATASVPVMERSSQRGRDRPGTSPDLPDAPGSVMPHHYPARVAG